jgi:hypothetical protein
MGRVSRIAFPDGIPGTSGVRKPPAGDSDARLRCPLRWQCPITLGEQSASGNPAGTPMPLLAGLGAGKATFLLHRAIVAATPTADTAACKAGAAHSVLPPMRQIPGDEGIVVALGVGGIKPVDAGGLPLTERFAGIETMARAH